VGETPPFYYNGEYMITGKKYFKVTAPDEMGPGGVWRKLMRCKDHAGNIVNLDPTVESKTKGEGHKLEWLVPDNEYNRDHILHKMPKYTTEALMQTKEGFVPKVATKTLKSQIKEKLDAIGIEYSVSAPLKELQKILAEAEELRASMDKDDSSED